MNWLKSVLFEEDPKAAQAPKPAQGPTVTNAASPAGVASAMSALAATPGVNPEFIAAIRKAIFSKNTALTQLMTAADALQSIIPDQITRFKAAYATAGNGRTPQQVVSAADIHLADIDGEVARFKVALDQKLGSEIQQLGLTIQQAEAQASAAGDEISRLTARITELQGQIQQLGQTRAQAVTAKSQKEAELEHTASNFAMAANAVRGELQAIKTTVAAALG